MYGDCSFHRIPAPISVVKIIISGFGLDFFSRKTKIMKKLVPGIISNISPFALIFLSFIFISIPVNCGKEKYNTWIKTYGGNN